MERDVVKDAHEYLETADLIQEAATERNEQVYVTTKRGDAMVDFILRTPVPVDVFLNPMTSEIYNPDEQ
jgi:hypothetical protein